MAETIGKRIAELRKARALTQEEVAQRLEVTPQAVSKWENDLSCPDIALLPVLGRLLGVTVDELLTGERLPEASAKSVDDMTLHIRFDPADGEPVNTDVPMQMLRTALDMGAENPEIKIGFGEGDDGVSIIDPKGLLEMVRHGFSGTVLEVETESGRAKVWVD